MAISFRARYRAPSLDYGLHGHLVLYFTACYVENVPGGRAPVRGRIVVRIVAADSPDAISNSAENGGGEITHKPGHNGNFAFCPALLGMTRDTFPIRLPGRGVAGGGGFLISGDTIKLSWVTFLFRFDSFDVNHR